MSFSRSKYQGPKSITPRNRPPKPRTTTPPTTEMMPEDTFIVHDDKPAFDFSRIDIGGEDLFMDDDDDDEIDEDFDENYDSARGVEKENGLHGEGVAENKLNDGVKGVNVKTEEIPKVDGATESNLKFREEKQSSETKKLHKVKNAKEKVGKATGDTECVAKKSMKQSDKSRLVIPSDDVAISQPTEAPLRRDAKKESNVSVAVVTKSDTVTLEKDTQFSTGIDVRNQEKLNENHIIKTTREPIKFTSSKNKISANKNKEPFGTKTIRSRNWIETSAEINPNADNDTEFNGDNAFVNPLAVKVQKLDFASLLSESDKERLNLSNSIETMEISKDKISTMENSVNIGMTENSVPLFLSGDSSGNNMSEDKSIDPFAMKVQRFNFGSLLRDIGKENSELFSRSLKLPFSNQPLTTEKEHSDKLYNTDPACYSYNPEKASDPRLVSSMGSLEHSTVNTKYNRSIMAEGLSPRGRPSNYKGSEQSVGKLHSGTYVKVANK